jgi:hypothetical protein
MQTATLTDRVVTPSDIAREPIRIDVGDGEYSAQTQTRNFGCGPEPLTFTPSGTQTYGGNGRPIDADSD